MDGRFSLDREGEDIPVIIVYMFSDNIGSTRRATEHGIHLLNKIGSLEVYQKPGKIATEWNRDRIQSVFERDNNQTSGIIHLIVFFDPTTKK